MTKLVQQAVAAISHYRRRLQVTMLAAAVMLGARSEARADALLTEARSVERLFRSADGARIARRSSVVPDRDKTIQAVLRYPMFFYRIAERALILHIRHTSRRPIDPATEL